MCGIVGSADLDLRRPADPRALTAMARTLTHRGPDDEGSCFQDGVGMAVRRLSIVDVPGGRQPMSNEDGTVVVCCNGEIFNHQELREELRAAGHRFRTACDVEVLVHLYEEYGTGLVHRLNGQFSFAVHDLRRRRLVLARDQAGITPLHYTTVDRTLLFASEIKALLAHPRTPRAVDLTGLDQVLVLPGLVSPRTMFAGISSLPPGHLLVLEDGRVRIEQYWDLDYPRLPDLPTLPDPEPAAASAYVGELESALLRSVELRMRADVPHAYYLSGGLDSSLVAAMATGLRPGDRPRTFSAVFPGGEMSEQPFQRLMAEKLGSLHTEVPLTPGDLLDGLPEVIRHCECPVKESYNVASLRLSRAVRSQGGKVVLTGEGADELFAGYIGYQYDRFRIARSDPARPLSAEERLRARLWGHPQLAYGREFAGLARLRRRLYSRQLAHRLNDFSSLAEPLVDPARLEGRHILHQRSYLDFKLRLPDHLLGDHGDRMALANSVEARYPFLDPGVIACARTMPPDMLLADFEEKYPVKRVADDYLPADVVEREKFAFRSHTSPELLRLGRDWADALLDPVRIRREGYFDPEAVRHLRSRLPDGERGLDLLVEDDVLMLVLTFGLFLETFDLPHLT
ncbi:asparagine synthase (glutamine-hydrolyzing) [Streptomyces sp. NPDC091292]|uniref:asparagine synthase (glutamine-hydrolyzing) n=1 Tax=Streptomyces sp. NPDC091292 TaxID=3365991 RepID=UPI00382EBE3A